MTAAWAVPSLLWGLNSLTLPGPTPVPSPLRPLQMKTQNHFKSPLAGLANKPHITDVLPVLPGSRDLCAFSLASWISECPDFFPKSPSSSRGLGPPYKRSSLLTPPRSQGAGSSSPFLARLQPFGKSEIRGFFQEEMWGDRKNKLFSRFRFLRKVWRV